MRVSVFAFYVGLVLRVWQPPWRRTRRVAAIFWLVGWAACLAHVLAAFHFRHGWSHRAAWEHVAQRTQEQVGWYFGDGLYVNYAFMAVYGFDLLWYWRTLGREATPKIRIRDLACIGFLWFVMINATIVFESGFVRWLSLAGSGTLVVALAQTFASSRDTLPRSS